MTDAAADAEVADEEERWAARCHLLENQLYPPDISFSALSCVVLCLLGPFKSPGHQNMKVICTTRHVIAWETQYCIGNPLP